MTGQDYSGLAFSFSDMSKEILNMKQAASGLITPRSGRILDEWRQTLLDFQVNPLRGTKRWEITPNNPVQTVWEKGKYENDGKGGYTVCGKLSTVWDIHVPNPQSRKVDRKEFFLLGEASTSIEVIIKAEDDSELVLASWHFDICNVSAPGCHFHTQIPWPDTANIADNVSLKPLPVPRFPSMAVTPMDALEFLLAELFQTDWEKKASSGAREVKEWGKLSRSRLLSLLEWEQDVLRKTTGAPWTNLKHEWPRDAYMFAPDLRRR